MPLYAFRCEGCGQPFDVRATFAEKEAGLAPLCPACGGEDVKRIMTAGLLVRTGAGTTPGPACGPSSGVGCCPW